MAQVDLSFRLRSETTTNSSSATLKLIATENLAKTITGESGQLTSIQLLSSQVITSPLERDLFSVKLSAKVRNPAAATASALSPVTEVVTNFCASAVNQRSHIQMKFGANLATTENSDLVLVHNVENFSSFALGALLHGNTFAVASDHSRMPQSDGAIVGLVCKAVGSDPTPSSASRCAGRAAGGSERATVNFQNNANLFGADNSNLRNLLDILASNEFHFSDFGNRHRKSGSTAKITFEHDRKSFDVEFLVKDAGGAGRANWHVITVPYENIREIVVDYRVRVGREFVLYMELKYPILAKASVKGHKTRVTSFGTCTREHIGNSSCLRLKFDPSSETLVNELWRLIRRLQLRSGVDVWFGAISEARLQRSYSSCPSPLFRSNLNPSQQFAVVYALNAIWSSGYVAHCEVTTSFIANLEAIAGATIFNLNALLQTLFRFANAFNDGRKVSLACLQLEYDLAVKRLTERLQGEDPRCVFVRKVIRTPTRILFLEPERMLKNRIIEDFCHDPANRSQSDPAIRIVYRDENLRKLYFSDNVRNNMDAVFAQMIQTLTTGLTIANRTYHFLAASNSQLRDHSCYLFAQVNLGDPSTADIRKRMGKFDLMKDSRCVSKVLARMGQCFTQAFPTLAIPLQRMRDDPDIMSTVSHPDYLGDLYCFTDGIGRISPRFLGRVLQLLQEKYAIKLGHFPSAIQIRYQGYKGMLAVDPVLDKQSLDDGLFAAFRKSMYKFETPDGHRKFILEIVKWSQPVEVYLNRPLIEVFDKSTQANVVISTQIKACIHDLLEHQIFEMFEMLICERTAKAVLNRKTTIDLHFLRGNDAFAVTTEPFFRSLLQAIYLNGIRYINKLNVAIPHDKGRTMFGVIDECNVLRQNQVHVRYSQDIRNPGEELKTCVGPIIVTKNPTSVPGDLRVLEAVDCPELSHLVDVIVFPAGPLNTRPLPDQMAGSDLDGDEFSVFFCDGLLFRDNHTAMTFPKTAPELLGHFPSVASVLLQQADRLGFENDLVIGLAKKYSQALDFAKTGVPVGLSKEEKEGKAPDFMEHNRLSYRSDSLVGELHRKIKLITDCVALAEKCVDNSAVDVQPDPGLCHNLDWKTYKDEAIRLRDEYCVQITSLLDAYGIPSEAQLLSGHIVTLKNRIDSNEKENFTRFTTDVMVEQCVKEIWAKFRDLFFEGLEKGVSHDAVRVANAKASAWYIVTYDRQYGNTSGLLGFPWIVGDYLLAGYIPSVSPSSFNRHASEHTRGPITHRLFETLTINAAAMKAADSANARQRVAFGSLYALSADMHLVLVAWLRWLDAIGCLDAPAQSEGVAVSSDTACRLFLAFIRNENQNAKAEGAAAANVLVSLLKHLASNDFRLQRFNYSYGLKVLVIMKLHKHALSALHHIAFTGLFDSLQLTAKSDKPVWDFGETRMLQIEADVFGSKGSDECLRLLKQWSGCAAIAMRELNFPKGVFAITGAGTLEARRKLESILMCPRLATGFAYGSEDMMLNDLKLIYTY